MIITANIIIIITTITIIQIITNIIIIIIIISLIRMTMRGSCPECIAGANLLLKPLLTPARATWSTSVLIVIITITIIIIITFVTIAKKYHTGKSSLQRLPQSPSR